MDGRPLDRSPEDLGLAGGALGRAHAILAGAPPPTGLQPWPWAWLEDRPAEELRDGDLRAAVVSATRSVGALADERRLTLGTLNGDPALSSFRLDEASGAVGLIDWGSAMFGPLQALPRTSRGWQTLGAASGFRISRPTLDGVRLRDLPSVDRLLGDERLAGVDRRTATEAVRTALSAAREEIQAGGHPRDLVERVLAEVEAARAPRLRRVLNATGVLVHTNLGRAPLAEAALERVRDAARGYSNLEYDLASGARGSRQDHCAALLRRLTGAEAALAVNNNAGAVLLALAALAEGREVIVSRGELIEIGDGFRIPDVLARSGARLVEVGTTNRTRAADYERAVGAETALLLRVHQSNFRVVGFTEAPRLEELARVARRHALPLVDDLGSGALVPLGDEPLARDSLAAGADLVCFSGDKLLGGPQAGIVVGRAELVERLRRHPLQRALRADKLTLAALEGTLALYLDAPAQIPVLRMLGEDAPTVRARAERLASLVGGAVEQTVGRVGGGALPLAELESYACSVEEELAAALRLGEPPVVAVVRDGRTLLDCRTLTDAEVEEVAGAVAAARR